MIESVFGVFMLHLNIKTKLHIYSQAYTKVTKKVRRSEAVLLILSYTTIFLVAFPPQVQRIITYLCCLKL